MIKLFNKYIKELQIQNTCKKYNIENYTINKDGSIDVDGSVNLYDKGLTKLPLKFNRVNGDFWCSENYLTTLEGCPNEVGGTFHCAINKLITLKGCPKIVGGHFTCYNNHLTSLLYGPERVGDSLNCSNNKLLSLVGIPQIIRGNFYINNTSISIIDISIDIRGRIYLNDTNFDDKIKSLSQEKLKILFEHGVDYNIFDKDGNVNDFRLERLFKDFGV